MPGPEQTGDSKSDPSAEEEEAHLGNPEQQEFEVSTAEITAEIHQKQMEDGEDGNDNPSQSEETVKQKYGSEAAPLQVRSVTITRDKKKEQMTGEARNEEAGAPSTDIQQVGFNCGSVEFCEAAVSPGGSERKGSVSNGTRT